MGETVNLLIVEDNESDAALVVRQLERAGYTVATARRVDRAAEFGAALGACAWSAVLCDYALPGFSPEEALAQVQDSGLDLPFLVVSASLGDEDAGRLMALGATTTCTSTTSRASPRRWRAAWPRHASAGPAATPRTACAPAKRTCASGARWSRA